ncbi:MAG: hypothetical protein AB7P08_06100 [Burkholderiales bacterium]
MAPAAAFGPPLLYKRGNSNLEFTIALLGGAVVFLFMVSTTGHGYSALSLIPPLPFLSTEASGVLLAVGLAAFTYVAMSLVASRWTFRSSLARIFLALCCALVVSLDFVLIISSFVKQSTADAYIDDAKRRIDTHISTAETISSDMSSHYTRHVAVLNDLVERSKRGEDVSGVAKCGDICRARIEQRDRTERTYSTLSQPIAIPRVTTADGLSARFEALLAAQRSLESQFETFAGFERESGSTSPLGHRIKALGAEVEQVRSDVFRGGRAVSDHALTLRLTADMLARCLGGRGSAIEYLVTLVAVAIVLLLPAFAVARKLSGESEQSVEEQADALVREAKSYAALQDAIEKRGKAKLNADLAHHSWKTIASAGDL